MRQAFPTALAENRFFHATEVGTFETGRNVSDGRFLLETFATFGMSEAEWKQEKEICLPSTVRLDILQDYNEEAKALFMPYVAGYCLARGDRDLALFSVSAASNAMSKSSSIPEGAEGQLRFLLFNAVATLRDLGAGFDDVIHRGLG